MTYHSAKGMRRFGFVGFLTLAAAVAWGGDAPGSGAAQGKPPAPPSEAGVLSVSGSYAYRTYCASCHGTDGRGEGPLAENLRFHPPDLSLIARRHGGEFPAEEIRRIVDGRKPLPGHGGPEMPIWGDAFKSLETGFDDAKVKERIRSVVEHLRTLQAK